MAAETEQWWRTTVNNLAEANLEEALATLVEARAMFERGLSVHMVLSMAAQGLMGQVENTAVAAGLPSGGELIKSDEGTAEFELVRDLWRLSRDEIDIPTFCDAHGYHGSREGLVDSVVWRENPTAVVTLVERYRNRQGFEDVDALVARRRTEHAESVRRLHAGLRPVRRRVADVLLAVASYVPAWRETGRANILRGVDVARASARVVGARLAESGRLRRPEDVFFLTIDELTERNSQDLTALVDHRRAQHRAYQSIELPHVWRGVPTPVTATPSPIDGVAPEVSISGLGVSAGIAEGVVKVITDLDDADLDDGTVMVCKATDPSWASLFPLAVAVVTDVGSAMSHAAIVCRELGLPCVANTRSGTTDLSDGMLVRVDGSTGVVEILSAR